MHVGMAAIIAFSGKCDKSKHLERMQFGALGDFNLKQHPGCR
jgi:hypothetical protein